MKMKLVAIHCDPLQSYGSHFSNLNNCNSLRLTATHCDSLRLLVIKWKQGFAFRNRNESKVKRWASAAPEARCGRPSR